jgi:hypothetical protein
MANLLFCQKRETKMSNLIIKQANSHVNCCAGWASRRDGCCRCEHAKSAAWLVAAETAPGMRSARARYRQPWLQENKRQLSKKWSIAYRQQPNVQFEFLTSLALISGKSRKQNLEMIAGRWSAADRHWLCSDRSG